MEITTDFQRFDKHVVTQLGAEVRKLIQVDNGIAVFIDDEENSELVDFVKWASNGTQEDKYVNNLLLAITRNPNLVLDDTIGLLIRMFMALKFGILTLNDKEYKILTDIIGHRLIIPSDSERSATVDFTYTIKSKGGFFNQVPDISSTGAQTPKILNQPSYFDPGPYKSTDLSSDRLTAASSYNILEQVSAPVPTSTVEDLMKIFLTLNEPLDSDAVANIWDKIRYKGFNPAKFVRHCIMDLNMTAYDFKVFAFIGALTANPTKVDGAALKLLGVRYPIDTFVKGKKEMQTRGLSVETTLTFPRFTSCIPAFVAFTLAQCVEKELWHGYYIDDACPAPLQFFAAVSLRLNERVRKLHYAWAQRHSVAVSRESKKEFNSQLYDQLASQPVPREAIPDVILQWLLEEDYCVY